MTKFGIPFNAQTQYGRPSDFRRLGRRRQDSTFRFSDFSNTISTRSPARTGNFWRSSGTEFQLRRQGKTRRTI
ncbi:MAG: hypothetical protein WKF71_11365 [Pyrinomonadaceae bacterium]